MRPTNRIGSTHEDEMNLILEFILTFDVNRLLYAINGKQLREEDIISLKTDIQEYYIKLSRQKTYLFRFGMTFNKIFAHEDNKCFDTSIKLARRMRSGLSGVKKAVIRPFVKISRKRLPNGMPPPSILDRSLISSENYSVDLYGLSSYPDSVKDLFSVMIQFYEVLNDCIKECKRVLEEEKVIKSDDRLSLERLNAALENSTKNQLHIIEAIERDPAFKDSIKKSPYLLSDDQNPVLKAFKKNSTSGKFARVYFHNCSPSDIGKITLYKAWNESKEDPMLMLAHSLFNDDDEKIKRINYVIRHFDKLLPPVCKRKVIPAYHLYVFMEWCEITTGTDHFLNYFEKYYHSAGGKWKVVGKTAINGAKNRPYQDKYKDECKKIHDNMLHGINNLLSNYSDEEMTE